MPSGSSPLTGSALHPTRSPPNPSRQRFKPQLSCTQCRSRKLKCDRDLPCENCVKRNLASSCTYIHADMKAKQRAHVHKISNGANKDLQDRIRHLEELVISAMNHASSDTESLELSQRVENNVQKTPDIFVQSNPYHWMDPILLKDTAESLERVSIGDDGASSLVDDSWSAILDNIAGLRNTLENDSPESKDPDPTPLDGPDLLIGLQRISSKLEILSQLPAKHVTDRLIILYFDSKDVASIIIHAPTFKKEYARFWLDPSDTSIVWIGLLFAVLNLSLHLERTSGVCPSQALAGEVLRDVDERMDTFRRLAAQCLILSNYTDPSLSTVESFMLYFLAEYFHAGNTHGNWLLFGILVRSAMQMRFHKDPSHDSTISVFRGEMQRRIWLSITHLDLHTSSQRGLPRMIKEGMSDTRMPRILLDTDLNEDMKDLPAAREGEDISTSPLGYLALKTSITTLYGTVVDSAYSVKPMSYDEVMRIDKMLEDVHDRIPEVVKARSVEDLKTGSPDVRLRKFTFEICYSKARCALHRRFLIPNESQQEHAYSTNACLDSAMQILHFQSYVFSETMHGELLYRNRWNTVTVVSHDFVLADIVLCSYLGRLCSSDGQSLAAMPSRWTKGDLLEALEMSSRVWQGSANISGEVLATSKKLCSMVARLRKMASIDTSQHHSSKNSPSTMSNSTDHSAMGKASLATEFDIDLMKQSTPVINRSPTAEFSYMPDPDTFNVNSVIELDGSAMNIPMDLDWDIMDTTFQLNMQNRADDMWTMNDPLDIS